MVKSHLGEKCKKENSPKTIYVCNYLSRLGVKPGSTDWEVSIDYLPDEGREAWGKEVRDEGIRKKEKKGSL